MNDQPTFAAAVPMTINHFIGQQHVVKRIQADLNATWCNGRRMPHYLLLGEAGEGKTLLANTIAREVGMEAPITTMGAAISTPADMNRQLMRVRMDGEVLFIDEIHAVSPKAQIQLYDVMTGGCINLTDEGSDDSNKLTLPDFTIIGATTDEHLLSGPLRSRFEATLGLRRYTDDELSKIIEQRVKLMNWRIEKSVPAFLAKRSKGIARRAMNLLKAAERMRTAEEPNGSIQMKHARQVASLEELDSIGLTREQQQYIRLLQGGQSHQVSVLAMRLGTETRNLQKVLEPDLFHLGLITKRGNLRALTPSGESHSRQLFGSEVAHETA